MDGCNGFWWIIEAVHFIDDLSDTMAYSLHNVSGPFSALAKATKILGEHEVVLHTEKSSIPR